MAGEIQLPYGVSGRTLYAVVRSAAATIWNGTTLTTYVNANWSTYAITLTEQGTSGYYVGDFPAVAAGVYDVEVRDRAGGSPAVTDPLAGSGQIDWNGTALVGAGSLDTHLTQISNRTDNLTFDGGTGGVVSYVTSIANDRITAAALAADAVTEIKAAITDTTLSGSLLNTIAADYDGGTLQTGLSGDLHGKVLGESGGVGGGGTISATGARVVDSSGNAIPTAAQNATAWGTRVLGNGRTADMFLQGLTNRIAFSADGLSFTLYSTDDTTPLFNGTATRLATTVGGLRSVDPT